MRFILILAAALVLAGCTESGGDAPAAEAAPDPVAPAADENETTTPSTPPPAPPEETEPVEPTPPPAVEEENETVEPPAPQPVPWDIAEQVSLGWVAAVGAGGQAQAEAANQEDAAHCPNATFAVPEGATEMTLTITPSYANPESAGAGQFVIRLTAPDGTVTELTAEEPNPQSTSPSPEPIVHVVTAPPPGAWSLSALPMGPAVQQTWPVDIFVKGASPAAPETLGAATTC